MRQAQKYVRSLGSRWKKMSMALLGTWTLSFQCNWLSKLKEAQENWKRTLQTTVFKGGLTSGVGHNNQSPPPESSLTN